MYKAVLRSFFTATQFHHFLSNEQPHSGLQYLFRCWQCWRGSSTTPTSQTESTTFGNGEHSKSRCETASNCFCEQTNYQTTRRFLLFTPMKHNNWPPQRQNPVLCSEVVLYSLTCPLGHSTHRIHQFEDPAVRYQDVDGQFKNHHHGMLNVHLEFGTNLGFGHIQDWMVATQTTLSGMDRVVTTPKKRPSLRARSPNSDGPCLVKQASGIDKGSVPASPLFLDQAVGWMVRKNLCPNTGVSS